MKKLFIKIEKEIRYCLVWKLHLIEPNIADKFERFNKEVLRGTFILQKWQKTFLKKWHSCEGDSKAKSSDRSASFAYAYAVREFKQKENQMNWETQYKYYMATYGQVYYDFVNNKFIHPENVKINMLEDKHNA